MKTEKSNWDATCAILEADLERLRCEAKLKDDAHVEALQQVKDENEIESADLCKAFQKTLVDICRRLGSELCHWLCWLGPKGQMRCLLQVGGDKES